MTDAKQATSGVGATRTTSCNACGSGNLEQFYRVRGIPAQSTVLIDSEEDARGYPTGEVALDLCRTCGFIQNSAFDQSLVDYSLPTEESQAFSARFLDHTDELAKRLAADSGLVGGTVMEVGSGKGDFLEAVFEAGAAKAIGIDPGFLPDRGPKSRPGLVFYREFFDKSLTHMSGDLIVARHVLEHIPKVNEFLSLLRESASRTEGATLFVEVPDTSRIIDEAAFWDVYYEHCSYFTTASLALTLRGAGLKPSRLELAFDSQYILSWSHADPAAGPPEKLDRDERLGPATRSFAERATAAIDMWHSRLNADGEGVVLWGASSKTVAFLAAIDNPEVIVVDINPHKQFKWLPGSGIRVDPPERLRELNPHLVVPMNPVYSKEIEAHCRSMGLDPEFEPVSVSA